MRTDPFLKRAATVILLFAMLFSGVPVSFLSRLPVLQGRIVDESYLRGSPLALPMAEAAAKTKTIVFFIGSLISTTAVGSGATSTFTFTITLPDLVPDAQPIRSAYISYNAWGNNATGITSSAFTLNKQGGTAQSLAGPKLTGGTTEQQLSMRLDATAAMRTLIGSTANTYAMTFTSNLAGPTRMGENAELYVTYDYDPLAATQVNTVYQYVFSSSSQISTTNVSSTAFNFNLPETAATTTFAVSGSSTNQFWVEYRGFIASSSNVTATVGWDSETTSSLTFTQVTQQFSFMLLVPSKTANRSPNTATNVFRMISSVANGISAPTAIAVATYTFNFSGSAKLRKTVQALLFQSTATASNATVSGATALNIPETSPSSTNVFLLGRFANGTSSNPGINGFATTSACSVPATAAVTIGAAPAKNSGYVTVVQNISASSSINAAGNWNICSSFAMSVAANIPGLMAYISYDYANSFVAGTRFNTNVSFIGASHLSATGTTGGIFAASGINASIVNASATPTYSWLDAEFDNNAPGTVAQALTLGIGATTNAYTFVARGTTSRRQGATFSATSSVGFSANVTTTVQCSVACVNDAVYNVLGQTDMIASNLTQAHYHWRNNDASGSPQASEDTASTSVQNTVDRLRIEISNAGDVATTTAFRIEYQKNATTSNGWAPLATSTATADWQMATSSNVSDGTATTNISTSTGGTTDPSLNVNPLFNAGETVASTSRNQTAVPASLSGLQFTEVEFLVRSTALASTGVPYYFRVSNSGTSTGMTYSMYPSMTVTVAPSPVTVSAVGIASSTITLTPATTTAMNVFATISDTSGCAAITGGTTTVALYRYGVSSTCMSGATSSLNCYLLTAFTASSTCAANSVNTTTTFNLYYFAQPTDGSSSFSGQGWQAAVIFKDASNATGTATSPTSTMSTLAAINVTTSSISFGNLAPGVTSATSTTIITNAGNSSTTLKLSASSVLTLGSFTIGADYEHYATTSFTWSSAGSDVHLSTTSVAVSGFVLTAPTSTTNVQSSLFWALQPPLGTASGTYAGVNQFTAIYSP